MYEKLLEQSMKKVPTLKKPKRLTNSQLRNLKRQALANPMPRPQLKPNPLRQAIQHQNQLAMHQRRAADREKSRKAFQYNA